jgi:alkanesulfonate monooxygenase SsuD/methylene tetrahydromethanopterin reductase-like flavin-dependent oxidoreductase (luciferase family)
LVLGAALTQKTAAFLASWADGLITVNQPLHKLRGMQEAWQNAGGNDKPMYLKLQVSYDAHPDKARQLAFEQWKTNVFESDQLSELRNPRQFEQAAAHVKPQDMDDHVIISNDPEVYINQIEEYRKMGFTAISVHNVNKQQQAFIKFFAEQVLPHFED